MACNGSLAPLRTHSLTSHIELIFYLIVPQLRRLSNVGAKSSAKITLFEKQSRSFIEGTAGSTWRISDNSRMPASLCGIVTLRFPFEHVEEIATSSVQYFALLGSL